MRHLNLKFNFIKTLSGDLSYEVVSVKTTQHWGSAGSKKAPNKTKPNIASQPS